MIETITVKQQKELYRLMRTLRQKCGRFITFDISTRYHNEEPIQEFTFYDELSGHDRFDFVKDLIDHVDMRIRKEEYAHRD